jgi:hypothetical protein
MLGCEGMSPAASGRSGDTRLSNSLHATAASGAVAGTRTGWDRKDTAAWLLLTLLPIGLHLPALTGWLAENPIYVLSGLSDLVWRPNGVLPGYPGWIDGNAGVTTQALGWLGADDWLHGRVPWWNPYSGVGLPLAAEMQNAAFFLPFVLLLHLFDGVTLLKIAMQVLAGCATCALLRQLGLVRRAAVVGAVLMEANGSFAWFAHAPIMPIPFLPLLLLGIERARMQAERGAAGGWRAVTLGIGWSLLAGFPETAYLDGLLALVWAAWRLATLPQGRAAFAAKLAWGGVLGMALAAPAVLPFLELLPVSFLGNHADFSSARFLPGNYAMLLFPYIYGPPMYGLMFGQAPFLWYTTGGYLGFASLVMAVLALAGRGRDRGLRRVLALWVLLTLGKAVHAPVATGLLDAVPFVRQSFFNVYIEPSWQMAAVVLAALLLDDWHRGRMGGLRARGIAIGASVLAAAAALVVAGGEVRALHHVAPYARTFAVLSVGWAGAVAAGVVALCACASSRGRSTLLCGLVLADALVLFTVPLLCGTRGGRIELAEMKFLRSHLGLQRVYSIDALVPNYGAMFGIASINHNYLPVPQNWVAFVRARLVPEMDGVNFYGAPAGPGRPSAVDLLRTRLADYEATGVKYVLVPPGQDPFGDAGPARVFAGRRMDIYELPHPAPYFTADGADCTLAPRSRTAVDATCRSAATLVRRELLFPGWRASVNGNPVPIALINGIFQRVALPAGFATIRFRYAPPHIGWAWAACALAVLGILAPGRRRRSCPAAAFAPKLGG